MTEEVEFIIEKSGSQPNECGCTKCQNMCKRASCLGTPSDILAIAEAGFADCLTPVTLAAGLKDNIPMVDLVIMPDFEKEKGACTFFNDGKCELHDKGLKPLEGRLAECKKKFYKADQMPHEYLIAHSWNNPRNQPIIAKIDALMFNAVLDKLLKIMQDADI